MLTVSNELKNAFMEHERTIFVRIKIGNRTFDNDNVVSVEYDSGSLSGEVFAIGSTYSNSIKITFSELVEGLKELDEVTYEIGIKLADGKIEYVPMGVFVINDAIEMDRNNNKTTIECMDRMVMMGGAYVSSLTYPAAIREVALEIANKAGVSVDVTSFERLSADRIAKPEGYTYREAIGLIAQFEAGFATFNRYGKLEIRTLSDPNFAIPPDNYFSKGLVKNEVFFRLGGISCTTDESGDAVIQSGNSTGNQIVLENRVMTKVLLDKIYQKIQTINYYPFSLSWQGNPVLEAGDWVEVEDLQGNKFKTPNLSYSLSFNGGLSAKSSAETVTQSDATYQYKSPLQQKIEWIHARIDAAGGNVVYEGIDEPANPKEGDLWFKIIGPDKEILIYKKRADGSLFWEPQISTADIDKVAKEVEAVIKQADADREATEQKFDQAVTDAKAYTEQKANEFNNQMEIVRADVADTELKANAAVAKADQAIADAGFVGANLTQVKSDAANALSTAQNSLATSATAIENAANALRAYDDLEIGGRNFILNSGVALSVSNTNIMVGNIVNLSEFKGRTITISVDVDVVNKTSGTRIGTEVGISYSDGTTGYIGVWKTIVNGESFKGRISATLTFKDVDIINNPTLRLYSQLTAEKSYVGYPKLEFGNKATGWSPAPEDVQVQITDINGELSRKVAQTTFDTLNGTVNTVSTIAYQNKTDIGAKADREVVNTISQTVEKHTLDIKANADGLKFKADSSLVNAIDKTVTSHTAELGVQAQAINARLTSTQMDTILNGKNYVNQTTLDATANGLKANITQVSSDLEGLEIGGRNLIKNSNYFTNLDGWTGTGLKIVEKDGYKTLSSTSTSTSVTLLQGVTGINRIRLEADTEYIYSARIMFDKDTKILANTPLHSQWQGNGSNGGAVINQTLLSDSYVPANTWSTIIIRGKTKQEITNDSAFVPFMYGLPAGTTFWIQWIQFKQGNKFEPYSPAFEDYATVEQFTTIDATVKGLQTTVGNKAEQSQVTQLAGQVSSKVDSATYSSKMTQLDKAINLRVESGKLMSQLNLNPEGILLQGENIQLDGNVQMDAAFINKLKVYSIDAVYAEIATLRTKLFIADSVTANMVKADAGLFDKVFINDTVVNKLTAKTSFINSVKAIEVVADRITTGTFNAAKVAIINLDASRIVSGSLVGINIKSAVNGSTFEVQGNNLKMTKANGDNLVMDTSGIYWKNSVGQTLFQTSNKMTTSDIFGTSEWNVYLAAFNESRSVTQASALTGSGAIADYKYVPHRADGFYGNFLENNTGNSGFHIYVRPDFGGELRVTKPGQTDDYQPVRAQIAYAHRIALNTYNTSSNHLYIGAPDEVRFTSSNENTTPTGAIRAGQVFTGSVALNTASGSDSFYLNLMGNNGVRVRTENNDAYKPISASAFNVGSSQDFKKGIDIFEGSAVEMINSTPVKEYWLNDDNEAIDYKRIGLVVQEAPKEIINFSGGDSIDMYAMSSILWKAVQEQSKEITELKTKIQQLESAA